MNGKGGRANFEAIELSGLDKVSVVAQALDNQWVPRDLLHTMLDKHLSLEEVRAQREQYARTEYLRALVNAKQIVINRAYLYNNPVVFQDHLEPGETRKAFHDLLGQGAIVPYLFSEQAPDEDPKFTTDPRGFAAWRQVCGETRMRCVRLSWDDEANTELIRDQLSRRFHGFAQVANSKDMDVLLRDLGLPPEAKDGLQERLTNLGHTCVALAGRGRLATREDLYREFVVASGSDPAEGKYDAAKPFAGEIKQLLDLCYNMNLPDALGGYALTPVDALPRTALQEWPPTQQQQDITGDKLVDLLRRTAFDLLQGGLYLKSLGLLRLAEVQEVRRMDEWAQYIRSVETLLDDPLQFPDPAKGAAAVYRQYVKLAGAISDVAARGKAQQRTARWVPAIQLVVDIAGAVLSVMWSGQGTTYSTAGKISAQVGGKAAPVVARLIIRGVTEMGSQADLVTSIDFMRGRIHYAREQWEIIRRKAAEIPGFAEVAAKLGGQQDPTINYSEGSNV